MIRLTSMKHSAPLLTLHARAMRREPSAAENRLWQALRNRQLEYEKFVRQEPLGPFIADFVCRRCKLVVEVDGTSHDDADDHDARRTAALERVGYRVIRFSNAEVLGDLGPVLDGIRVALK
jgi:very-short-patch-repair endonuclease